VSAALTPAVEDDLYTANGYRCPCGQHHARTTCTAGRRHEERPTVELPVLERSPRRLVDLLRTRPAPLTAAYRDDCECGLCVFERQQAEPELQQVRS
jgi:hypothetical protein